MSLVIWDQSYSVPGGNRPVFRSMADSPDKFTRK